MAFHHPYRVRRCPPDASEYGFGFISVTLYSLPYVVGLGSFLVAAHQVAPSLTTLRALSDTSTISALISGQVVNRSLKTDRLPIKQAVPRADEKGYIKVPAQIVPSQKSISIVSLQLM
jgi:hypothetical protein